MIDEIMETHLSAIIFEMKLSSAPDPTGAISPDRLAEGSASPVELDDTVVDVAASLLEPLAALGLGRNIVRDPSMTMRETTTTKTPTFL